MPGFPDFDNPVEPGASGRLATVQRRVLATYELLRTANPQGYPSGGEPWVILAGPCVSGIRGAGGTVADAWNPTDADAATVPDSRAEELVDRIALAAFASALGSYAGVDETAAGTAKYRSQVRDALEKMLKYLQDRCKALYGVGSNPTQAVRSGTMDPPAVPPGLVTPGLGGLGVAVPGVDPRTGRAYPFPNRQGWGGWR